MDAAARETIAKTDLPVYVHRTEHGFGLEIHESPFLMADAKGKLEAGQVITIEAGMYIPGKLGVRIENDILVTETGHKVLIRRYWDDAGAGKCADVVSLRGRWVGLLAQLGGHRRQHRLGYRQFILAVRHLCG
ncbi:MAG: M24 family metallopeptidase [Planctomycetes bacterium]|nr:M24 family metallopeptidase [Planctomycetota bacterium]MBL7188576.1 M24 family metallopeptidase [Phycisphaerae bacterium]